jgi:hypothetical protein
VIAAALIAFSASLLFLIYFCAIKTYLQFSSHEMLVCREISEPWACEKKFKKELQAYLRFGEIESCWARKDPNKQLLHLQLSFTVLHKKIQWKYEDEIRLPLQGS